MSERVPVRTDRTTGNRVAVGGVDASAPCCRCGNVTGGGVYVSAQPTAFLCYWRELGVYPRTGGAA